ncbi:MAG: hypothetical protein H6636_02290 [Anaerolineales bacterium]|nr:hypothetical protein [Anaerolineales bacterium]
MNDQEITLPEKCCAKCGFLYAVNSIASNPSDEIIDPDLLRLNGGKRYQADLAAEELTLKPYRLAGGAGLRPIRWQSVDLIACLQNKFDTIHIHTRKAHPDLNAVETAYQTVFHDRADCSDFFSYHPGFSAKEHAEIRLQEKREAVLDEYWERDNFRENVLGIITLVLTIASIILAYLYGAK